MADIFLFNGGPYKRGADDGRVRLPLDCVEAQMIHADPELINGTNGLSDTIILSSYPELNGLAVGDNVYINVLPDATLYRGLWALPQDSLPGFTFDLTLVDVCEVSVAIDAGTDTALITEAIAGATISVDATAGLGDATKDACEKAEFVQAPFSDYRDVSAFVSGVFPGAIQPLGQALYVRLTVTAIPAELGTSNCGSCGEDVGLPALQFGVVADQLNIDKQRVAAFCRCKSRICAGCGCE